MKRDGADLLGDNHILPTIYEFPQILSPNQESCQPKTISTGDVLAALLTPQTLRSQSCVFQEIQIQQKKRHDRVFQLMTVCTKDLYCLYVHSMSQDDSQDQVTSQIRQLLSQKQSKILGQLYSGKLTVQIGTHVSRYTIKGTICKTEPKEGSVGNNTLDVGTGVQLRNLTQLKKLHSLFRLGSVQTEIASAFVRQNRLQKIRSQQRLQRLRQQRELITKAELIAIGDKAQKQQSLKREDLIKNISDRVLRRGQCKRKRIQREIEFNQFIKIYRQSRPLFQKNLEKMAELQDQQKDRVSSRLREIRSQVRPVRGQEIDNFERSYLLRRQQTRRNRSSQLWEYKRQLESSNKHYYRSRFHDIIRTQPNESLLSDQKVQREKDKRHKRLQYSQEIKTKIKVVVDPKKRDQMIHLSQHRLSNNPRQIRLLQNLSDQGVQSQKDTRFSLGKRDGLRFLKYARQRRNMTVVMKQPSKLQESQTVHTVTRPISTRTQTQLHDLWMKRLQDSDESPRSKKMLLKTRLDSLQTKARRAQQLSRIKSEGGRFPQSPNRAADEFLVNSIKTKLEFLGM